MTIDPRLLGGTSGKPAELQAHEMQLAARQELIRRCVAMKAEAEKLKLDPPIIGQTHTLVNEDHTMCVVMRDNGVGLIPLPFNLVGMLWFNLPTGLARAKGWNDLLTPEQVEAGCKVRCMARGAVLNCIVQLCDFSLSQLRVNA